MWRGWSSQVVTDVGWSLSHHRVPEDKAYQKGILPVLVTA